MNIKLLKIYRKLSRGLSSISFAHWKYWLVGALSCVIVATGLIGGTLWAKQAYEGSEAGVHAQNNLVLRTGTAGVWAYKCIYQPDNLFVGPSMCGMEQGIYIKTSPKEKPVRFGTFFFSHGTSDPIKTNLRTIPWYLTITVPSGIDIKQPANVLLGRTKLPLTWKSCSSNGCVAEHILNNEEGITVTHSSHLAVVYYLNNKKEVKINMSLTGIKTSASVLQGWTNETVLRK